MCFAVIQSNSTLGNVKCLEFFQLFHECYIVTWLYADSAYGMPKKNEIASSITTATDSDCSNNCNNNYSNNVVSNCTRKRLFLISTRSIRFDFPDAYVVRRYTPRSSFTHGKMVDGKKDVYTHVSLNGRNMRGKHLLFTEARTPRNLSRKN